MPLKLVHNGDGKPRRAIVAGCASGTGPTWNHEAPMGSQVYLLPDEVGPRVCRVEGPTHPPYFLLADGRQEPCP